MSTVDVNVVCVQLSFYDQFKYLLMKTGFFADNIVTHFTASFLAVSILWCYFIFILVNSLILFVKCLLQKFLA